MIGAAEIDPKRRFATLYCRIAKGLFDNLVGGSEHWWADDEVERRPFAL
jgi:hypothetical protein